MSRKVTIVTNKAPASSLDWAHLARQQSDADTAASLAVRLHRLILAAIQSGDLKPGSRLKETDLVAAMNVSRTPLREALAGLRADGILELDTDGLRVRRLGWHDIRGLYELRETLEAMAARLAATNRGHAERAVISSICDAETALIDGGTTPVALAAHNRRFHKAIMEAAGNRFLAESLNRLSRMMVLLGATAYSLPPRVDAIRDEHIAINTAIMAGDGDGAEAAMRAHLQAALTARLTLLSHTAVAELD